MARQRINYKQNAVGIAFKARRNTNLSSGSGTSVDIVFDSEYYDYGSCYDTSTGLFTAPVDGIYHFAAGAFAETTTTTRVFLTPRGTASTINISNRGLDLEMTYHRRTESVWEGFMSAGQTFGITIWTQAVNQLNSPDTWFAGHLVTPV